MTTRDAYRKRLQEHLRETKQHANGVERRIKQLGGRAEASALPEPLLEAFDRMQEAGQKAAAAAQGPLHMLRGTGEQEKLLKNAKTEYASEAAEIATYQAIETLAEAVGDRETAGLARGIRREEERMARYLERLIPTLTKAVVQAEVPFPLSRLPFPADVDVDLRVRPCRSRVCTVTATWKEFPMSNSVWLPVPVPVPSLTGYTTTASSGTR